MRRRFKVPDCRFSHIKVKALAASGQWNEFHSFATERRPPIGYEPFVMALVFHNQPVSIICRYIERIESADDRFHFLFELKLWEPAIKLACWLKDTEKLNKIRGSCSDFQLQQSIVARLAQLA